MISSINTFLVFLFSVCGYCLSAQNVVIQKTFRQNLSSFPAIAAHRGGFDNNLPENSLALFDYTIKHTSMKPVILEVDIRVSAEGTLFVMHDNTVDRTTNGAGDISQLSDTYLKTLELKNKNGEWTDEKIPEFADLLLLLKNSHALLMLDIKGNIHKNVIQMIKNYAMEDRCIVLTFNLTNTLICKNLSDIIMISALVLSESDWNSFKSLGLPIAQSAIYLSNSVDSKLVESIKQSGVIMLADISETMNNNGMLYQKSKYLEKIERLNLGILITDFPVGVSELLNN